MMREHTGRMQRLVEDLLTLSALEASRGLSDEAPVDVAALLAGVRDEALALSAGRHRIELSIEEPVALLANAQELRSAFGNLVSNAVHYTPAGGDIRLRWGRRGAQGVFSVSDTGPGIEPRHIPRLTERFYRVDHSRSRETGGTGLGLAIVKHVLTRHQATLEIESEPGKGSCFSAVFPARRVRSAASAAQAAGRSNHSARACADGAPSAWIVASARMKSASVRWRRSWITANPRLLLLLSMTVFSVRMRFSSVQKTRLARRARNACYVGICPRRTTPRPALIDLV